jgi:beta-glucosidase
MKNKPLFPFGYGLTYTGFKYSNLKTDKKSMGMDEVVNVTFSLQNNGNYDSDEVAQAYVSFPGSKVERPGIALKGFKRVFVKKGETVNVTIPLKASDLTYWDTNKKVFILESGKLQINIGPSSADFRLKSGITIIPD